MGKYRLVSLTRRPILTRHIAVVGRWCAPCKTVTSIVCAHPVEPTAAPELSLEVIDARKFHIRNRWLIVITVLVEPGNWIRARTAIGWLVILWDRRRATLLHRSCSEKRSWQPKNRSGHGSEFQPSASA